MKFSKFIPVLLEFVKDKIAIKWLEKNVPTLELVSDAQASNI